MTKKEQLLNDAKELISRANKLIGNAEQLVKEAEKEAKKEESIYFDLTELTIGVSKCVIFDNEKCKKAGFEDAIFMQVRTAGEFQGVAFYLNGNYEWQLKKDINNYDFLLIPTKKKEDKLFQ